MRRPTLQKKDGCMGERIVNVLERLVHQNSPWRRQEESNEGRIVPSDHKQWRCNKNTEHLHPVDTQA